MKMERWEMKKRETETTKERVMITYQKGKERGGGGVIEMVKKQKNFD